MNSFLEWTEYLRIKTDIAQQQAAQLLECNGQRFLVDFGTDNCIEKALWIMESEMEVM